jgi:3-mercaptopyruvate sulfurtransferase SseA
LNCFRQRFGSSESPHPDRGSRFLRYDDFAVQVDGLDSELPTVDVAKRVFEAAGVSDHSRVVVYAASSTLAARAFFTLDAFGHKRVLLLDGGMGGMHAAGHVAGARQLTANSLVGADGRFLPRDQLQARLAAAGAQQSQPVVAYCMVGMRASVVYFVARHLGYDARLYDGSIQDWTRLKLPVKTGR